MLTSEAHRDLHASQHTYISQYRSLTHHHSRVSLQNLARCICMYTLCMHLCVHVHLHINKYLCIYGCAYLFLYLPTHFQPILLFSEISILSSVYHNQHQSQSAECIQHQLRLFILQVSLLFQFCFLSSHGPFAAFISQNTQLGLFFLQLRFVSHKSRLQTYHFQMSHLDIFIAVIISHFCIIALHSLPNVYQVSVDHLIIC